MNKIISIFFAAFILLFIINNAYGQEDEITLKKTGQPLDYTIKIIRVTNDSIIYKAFWKLHSLPLSELVSYRLNKKTVLISPLADQVVKKEDIIASKPSYFKDSINDGINQQSSMKGMFLKGERDAEKYYYARHGGAGGTFLTTIAVGGLLGLIPAIACSATPPRIDHLMIPDKNMLDNSSYVNGYRYNAHIIKKRRVWSMFGFGCAINVVTYLVFFH